MPSLVTCKGLYINHLVQSSQKPNEAENAIITEVNLRRSSSLLWVTQLVRGRAKV